MNTIEAIINQAWESKDTINANSKGPFHDAIYEAITLLDTGKVRTAEKIQNKWVINEWVKKVILLYFRISNNQVHKSTTNYYDKIPLKFNDWKEDKFIKAGIRICPGTIIRTGAYLAKNTVLMTSFVNIGSYIDQGTMIDSYATIGSCAQIGKNCHIASGAVIGGVLEPIQSSPVIIDDNCFIGANSSIVEGVNIQEGAVIGMGVSIGISTPIVDRETGNVTYGEIPKYSVVVSGTMPKSKDKYDIRTQCAVIVKNVDAKTRSKTSINELLRI